MEWVYRKYLKRTEVIKEVEKDGRLGGDGIGVRVEVVGKGGKGKEKGFKCRVEIEDKNKVKGTVGSKIVMIGKTKVRVEVVLIE